MTGVESSSPPFSGPSLTTKKRWVPQRGEGTEALSQRHRALNFFPQLAGRDVPAHGKSGRSVLARVHSVGVGKPKKTLWPLDGHTKAKHHLLTSYTNAWFAIVGQVFEHLLVVDGFAGPGEYENGEPGSPMLLLDSFIAQPPSTTAKAEFLFIEMDRRRAEHLQGLVAERPPSPQWSAEVITGNFSTVFPERWEAFRRLHPAAPVFAFIDPFGAGEDAANLATEIVATPSTEVLIYVPTAFLYRFHGEADFTNTMDKLYGGRERWEPAFQLEGLELRRFLQDAFAARMQESCKWVRFFEITPAGSPNSYTLFFGTNNKLGLERMKDAMWKVDPHGGTRFRDHTMVDEPVLFEPEPPLGALERQLQAHFADRPFSIEQAKDFTLFKTAFRHNAHLKKMLKEAEKAGRLEPHKPKPGRRPNTYPAGTWVRFVPSLALS